MRYRAWVIPWAFLLAPSGCDQRPTVPRPPPLPSTVVSGPAEYVTPDDAAAAGPRRGEADVDPASLPADPAALPGPVLRWLRAAEGPFGPVPTPVALWSPASLVVVHDRDAGALLGLDLEEGHVLWEVGLPPEGTGVHEMLPVERDGYLFVSRGRTVLAVDLARGAEAWNTDVAGEPDGPAFVAGGRLVVRTVELPRVDPADPDSDIDWEAEPEVALVAVDAAGGAIAWRVALGGDTQIAASPEYAVVATWLLPEETEGEAAAAPRGPEETVVDLYRLADGARAGGGRVPGYVGQPLAWNDLLLISAAADPGDEESFRTRLAAVRLPSLEPVWDLDLETEPRVERVTGSGLLVFGGTVARRVDLATGAVLAENDLAPLFPAPGGGEPVAQAADCVEVLAAAGNSLAYATVPWCSRKHFGLLDGTTLRPWRVLMGFDGQVATMLADSRTAVVEMQGGLAAVDLAAQGPTLLESTSFRGRIDGQALEIERGDLMLGSPLDGEAQEFALGGEAIGEAVVDALENGRPAERLFAATVLRYRPDAAAVPALIDVFAALRQQPPPYEPAMGEGPGAAELQEQLAWRLLEALAVCGDARATGTLAGLFRDEEAWSEGVRSLAMQGLTAIGTPEALGPIDEYRAARSRRAEPWVPPVVEGSAGRRYDDAGMFVAGLGGPDAGTDDPTRRTSEDGKIVALVAYAAGGTSDLWLLGEASGILVPHFTGVTSTYGLGILSVAPKADGASVVVRRTAGGPNCAICAAMGSEDGGPVQLPEDTLTFRWEDLRRDADADGWSDLLERRLHTAPDSADTDGDGIADAVDPAPRGTGPAAPARCSEPDVLCRAADGTCRRCLPGEAGACPREGVLPAAFFAEFAFRGGEVPLFVEGPAEVNLQYEGYGGPVIYLTPEEAEALRAEVGLDGATYFSFQRRYEEGPDGEYHAVGSPLDQVVFSEDGAEATVNVEQYQGMLNAVGHRIVLRCIGGRWYPLSIEMTWIS